MTAEADFLQQESNHADKQENVIGEETPDQQGQVLGAAGEDSVEIVHEAALLGAAGAGKGRVACADEEEKPQEESKPEEQEKPEDEESEEQPEEQEEETPEPEQQEEEKESDSQQDKQDDAQDQELEAVLKKAQERNDEHEADKKARMRKAPLPPNERDW